MKEKMSFVYIERTILFSKISKFKLVMWSSGLLGSILLIWLLVAAMRSKPSIESPSSQIEVNSIGEFTDSSVIFASCDYDYVDFHGIIEGAKKILAFMEKNIDNIAVIDAAIGPRIFEAQLRLFLLGHPKLPQSIQDSLQFIQYWCKNLSETIIQKELMLKRPMEQRDRMVRNMNWVNDTTIWESPGIGSWRTDSEAKMILSSNYTLESLLLKEQQEEEEQLMSEDTWDDCIDAVFQECTVTDDCAELLMGQIGIFYLLTHQIFYLHFAKKRNCYNNQHFRQKMGKHSIEELIHIMCNEVWQEAHVIEAADYPIYLRDLLGEQVTVCALRGYTQFLKVSWLRRLLSWQCESGCYTAYPSETTQEGNSTKSNPRAKRSDNTIETGSGECSVHFTSVALTTMAMHLRYLGDTCLRNY